MVYHLYGVRLHSAWALPYSKTIQPFVADVALTRRPAAYFVPARDEAGRLPQPWAPIVEGALADGRTYLQWPDRFEFLISADGGQIAARPLRDGAIEGFHTHLLGQALSFALIRQGLDPLHATAVTIGGAGAAFLGRSGFGKSSLAASFIGAGHQLLTDDLLVLTDGPSGLSAQPGPPRLKLHPHSARRLMPGARGTPMLRHMPKLLFPLKPGQVASGPANLRVLYVIAPPAPRTERTRVSIRRLGGRQACLALIRNTFNASIVERDRLQRQLAFAARVASAIPIKTLSYPRSFGWLPAVRDAIIADLARESATRGQ